MVFNYLLVTTRKSPSMGRYEVGGGVREVSLAKNRWGGPKTLYNKTLDPCRPLPGLAEYIF
jgi:hypothetical protein